MKKLNLIAALLLLTSCAENMVHPTRDISSEPEKYFLNTDVTLKRMRDLKVSALNDAQCFADPDTKIYLSNVLQTSTGNFPELKSQINVNKLQNTASTEYYFCRVTCSLNNRYAAFWTTLTDAPNRHESDNGFICQGVTMEQVKIPGTSLTTLGPVVHNISAFDLSEVVPRLRELNFKMSASTKAELDSNSFKNFAIVGKAYMSSTMPAMIDAGKILDQIAYQKTGHKAQLDKYVLMLKNNNGQIKGDFSTDYFIMLNFLQHGRHLLY